MHHPKHTPASPTHPSETPAPEKLCPGPSNATEQDKRYTDPAETRAQIPFSFIV